MGNEDDGERHVSVWTCGDKWARSTGFQSIVMRLWNEQNEAIPLANRLHSLSAATLEIPSLQSDGTLIFFSPSWSCVRLHESKLNICWGTFLIICMQWITCFAVVNLLLLRWNGQRHKHDTYLHRLGMKSRAKFLRSVPCFNSIVQPWTLNMPLCEPH